MGPSPVSRDATSTQTQALSLPLHERLFGHDSLSFDLFEGTVLSAAGAKVLYLSSDVIRGIHQALHHEAGEAWTVIMKSCGRAWGRRVATALERELRTVAGRRFESVTVAEYLDLVQSYFAYHGWGRMFVHIDGIETHGVFRAELRGSLFRETLAEVDGPVDHLVAGMLLGLLEQASQAELDVLEIEAPRQDATSVTHFVITAPERLAAAQQRAGADLERLMQELQGDATP